MAARHIFTIFLKRLYDLNMEAEEPDISTERNVINEIRKAIPRGIVLYNYSSDDTFNPLDRQLEIYIYLDTKNIDQSLRGIAKLRVICRLSLYNGTLTLRTIDRNFPVG